MGYIFFLFLVQNLRQKENIPDAWGKFDLLISSGLRSCELCLQLHVAMSPLAHCAKALVGAACWYRTDDGRVAFPVK